MHRCRGTLLAVLVVTLLTVGQLDNSAMRILWQLMKATVAGIVLLTGCFLVFRKRAGIVMRDVESDGTECPPLSSGLGFRSSRFETAHAVALTLLAPSTGPSRATNSIW